MKILLQRVSYASVAVDGKVVGEIGPGALVFLGVTHADTEEQVVWLASKLIHLRMFEDSQGKMNQSLLDKKGEILLISQFTLYADCLEGRRPSFTQAAHPEVAKPLYEKFIEEVQKAGIPTKTGVFGAEMKVLLLNDGPVTFLIEKLSQKIPSPT